MNRHLKNGSTAFSNLSKLPRRSNVVFMRIVQQATGNGDWRKDFRISMNSHEARRGISDAVKKEIRL
jgi:hypothetical protein